MSFASQPLTRRAFIGLGAAGLIGAALPSSLVRLREAVPTGPYRVTDIVARNTTNRPVLVEVYRPGARDPLLGFTLGPWGMFRWVAQPGGEIIARQSTQLFEVDGPGVEWACMFTDAEGRAYVYDTQHTIPRGI